MCVCVCVHTQVYLRYVMKANERKSSLFLFLILIIRIFS